jgi:hypothetical protein
MTNSEQRRLTNWRLKILQTATDAGNVARACRHFGISRKTFYTYQPCGRQRQRSSPSGRRVKKTRDRK